ncbi:TIGR01244 family sulfur transferase [Parasphingopyxis sp.]|uniref:TIGR01244 family sulfur transferase n=1 Tax=Parasphingopyxis sp. TaxID=1920299 RepID=UPI002632682A|nr:TIGR01244 family sulfur transferase [Parasphingopyxis sp.]
MFRTVTDRFLASPQISTDDVAEAAQMGVTLIINNRPDDEDPGQPAGATIAAAAQDAGMAYVTIPVTHAGFSVPQVEAMREALDGNDGKTLAFCRSGTRSTLLWALAEAHDGRDPETIAGEAANAGYDVSPIRSIMNAFAAAK